VGEARGAELNDVWASAAGIGGRGSENVGGVTNAVSL